MRFDMHIHSTHSPDSESSVADIINTAIKRKLDGISITDHNSFKGSKQALKINNSDLIIIPGAEYSTEAGHLLVYFLQQGLETLGLKRDSFGRYLSTELIAAAHEQNALVYIAHPFSRGRLYDNSILSMVDGIEVYNSRASKWGNPYCNRDAMDKAIKLRKPYSAGSDAHHLAEIGNAFVDISVNTKYTDDIKSALSSGCSMVYGKTSSSLYKAKSQLIKCKKEKSANIKPMLKLMYFFLRETSLKLGIGKSPDEGIYSLKDERIERHDFD